MKQKQKLLLQTPQASEKYLDVLMMIWHFGFSETDDPTIFITDCFEGTKSALNLYNFILEAEPYGYNYNVDIEFLHPQKPVMREFTYIHSTEIMHLVNKHLTQGIRQAIKDSNKYEFFEAYDTIELHANYVLIKLGGNPSYSITLKPVFLNPTVKQLSKMLHARGIK